MARTFRQIALTVVTSFAIGGCSDIQPATRLPLMADNVEFLTDACPPAPIPPVRMTRSGDGVAFVDQQSAATVAIMWPVGFALWDVRGVATLHSTDGDIVGREGDVIGVIRGVTGVRPGGVLRVCAVADRTYR